MVMKSSVSGDGRYGSTCRPGCVVACKMSLYGSVVELSALVILEICSEAIH